ncbi:MAG: CYTH domain-containing protein [Candidatus Moraniibacteriota bacterium]
MKTEFEARILEIDVAAITKTLEALGAEKVADRELRRFVYDLEPGNDDAWIRLRTDGTISTFTIKERRAEAIDGMRELEVVVGDFETAGFLLERLGHLPRWRQENRRTSYVLDGIEIEIDSWPLIPTYLEIEGRSVGEVLVSFSNLNAHVSQKNPLAG